MAEVEARLDTIRAAADQLRRCGQQLWNSEAVVRETTEILLLSQDSSQSAIETPVWYKISLDQVHSLTDKVMQLAQKLDEAADNIEGAVQSRGMGLNFTVPITSAVVEPAALASTTDISPETPPVALDTHNQEPRAELTESTATDVFVSSYNQDLYNEKLHYQQLLEEQAEELARLQAEREEKLSDLNALKNRIISLNPDAHLNSIARVQTLQNEVAMLDQAILQTENSMRTIDQQLESIVTRLERVTPGPLADLNLIQAMEHGQTNEWVRANTQDCVHYIVSRMPIPEGLAGDAHLWNENAARLTEYGIQSGHEPLVGSVLVMETDHPYADNINGHLMYVERIENGQVWVSDNMYPDEAVLLSDLMDDTSSEHITYLYFPWHTQA